MGMSPYWQKFHISFITHALLSGFNQERSSYIIKSDIQKEAWSFSIKSVVDDAMDKGFPMAKITERTEDVQSLFKGIPGSLRLDDPCKAVSWLRPALARACSCGPGRPGCGDAVRAGRRPVEPGGQVEMEVG